MLFRFSTYIYEISLPNLVPISIEDYLIYPLIDYQTILSSSVASSPNYILVHMGLNCENLFECNLLFLLEKQATSNFMVPRFSHTKLIITVFAFVFETLPIILSALSKQQYAHR